MNGAQDPAPVAQTAAHEATAAKVAAEPLSSAEDSSSESYHPDWTAGIHWRSVLSHRELVETVSPDELLRRRKEGFGSAKQLNNTLKGMRLEGIRKGYNYRVSASHTATNARVATLMRRHLLRKGYQVTQVDAGKPCEVEFAVVQ